MIAVAAKAFDKYSETFIRNHSLKISPGKTAVIVLGADRVSLPGVDRENVLLLGQDNLLLPRKLSSLFRLFIGGSVYHRGGDAEKRIVDFLKKKDIKAVLAEYGPVGCAIASACRKAGARLYVHFHGYDASMLLRHWHVRYSYKRLFEDAAGFIFPSRFLAEKLCASLGITSGDRIHVVPCCVEPEEFCCDGVKELTLLLAVGRFVPKKAPDKTLIAFSKVLNFFPSARLEMIGDGELLANCRELVKNLGIERHVVFHGSQPHAFVKERMRVAQLFMQHSVTAADGDVEGLPVAVLEAMASGAVVIATQHSGIPEAVVDGDTGYLVPEHDVDGMAQACLRLLQDDLLLQSMRQKARRRVEMLFTVDRQVSLLRNIMELKV
jgi:glycosyltransferase involved in cell wall biosynthesis